MPQGIPASLEALLQRCYNSNAKERPSMAQVVHALNEIILEQGIPSDPLGREYARLCN